MFFILTGGTIGCSSHIIPQLPQRNDAYSELLFWSYSIYFCDLCPELRIAFPSPRTNKICKPKKVMIYKRIV